MMFDHIAFDDGVLRLLDQTKLPGKVEYVELRDWQPVAEAIAKMIVRGAPAIGIAGAYGMAIAARDCAESGDRRRALESAASGLKGARPTAVNLAWAVDRVLAAIRAAIDRGADTKAIIAAAEHEARRIHEDDVARCRAIGDLGAALLTAGADVITHCNTGGLATGGYGTALGIIRATWRNGNLRHVYVTETRPLLQGARLTTWELAQDGIPHTLITDSMAATLMQGRLQSTLDVERSRSNVDRSIAGAPAIGAVIVGADRIARNGDVANKIGTYGLAVIAHAHRVPFIVAAPLSTFDLDAATGDDIPIEMRDPREVTKIGGVAIAPDGTAAANPAFDITPASLITAIVTERGIAQPPFETSIARLVEPPAVTELRA